MFAHRHLPPIAHEIRNLGEYEGDLRVNERLFTDLLDACDAVVSKLNALPPVS